MKGFKLIIKDAVLDSRPGIFKVRIPADYDKLSFYAFHTRLAD